jgi:nitrate/nitrite transport system substrate-binding protein
MWLYYWLAANGIHPFKDVKNIVVPPPQMVANMRVGNMDGFCVGEPWNARAIADGIGFTAVTSQDIWPDHPEKVLGTTAEFVAQYPNTARALTAAVLDAARWCDAQENRPEMADTVAAKSYVNCPVDIIKGRILGEYENGLGKKWTDAKPMRFFRDGEVTYPWLSDGMWFLTQHRRWGLMDKDPDYLAVAKAVNRIDVYTQAAAAVGVAVPKDTLRSSTLIDGTVWNGADPAAYAASFALKV